MHRLRPSRGFRLEIAGLGDPKLRGEFRQVIGAINTKAKTRRAKIKVREPNESKLSAFGHNASLSCRRQRSFMLLRWKPPCIFYRQQISDAKDAAHPSSRRYLVCRHRGVQ